MFTLCPIHPKYGLVSIRHHFCITQTVMDMMTELTPATGFQLLTLLGGRIVIKRDTSGTSACDCYGFVTWLRSDGDPVTSVDRLQQPMTHTQTNSQWSMSRLTIILALLAPTAHHGWSNTAEIASNPDPNTSQALPSHSY